MIAAETRADTIDVILPQNSNDFMGKASANR
jgi:hypothetical protein